ncbi:MAG: MFS transporter [Bryobacteraceae bacterium]
MASTQHSSARWRILALLFFGTTLTYLDRVFLSNLWPTLRDKMHFNAENYGDLTGAFALAYTVGYLVAGRFIDRFGSKIGYLVTIAWWAIASALVGLPALSTTLTGLLIWRGVLAFGEAGNFPAAIKSVAEWYPKQDRAFASSVFNSGSNVAAMFGPAVAGVLALTWGWRGAFYLNGVLGMVWVVLWLALYQNPPIQAEDEGVITAKIGWMGALKYPEAWGFALGKFLTDGVWWFYLFWLPPYLYDVRHFNLKDIGWAMPVLYSAASVGSLFGGAIPSFLCRRGWDMRQARPTAMAICALCMPVAATAVWVNNPVLMIVLICFGLGGHQGWSANIFSTTSDAFPKGAVASVTAIGGFTGGLGGYLFSAKLPGFIVGHFGSYVPMFVMMGSLHLIALLVMSQLSWRKRRQVAVAAV